MLKGIWDLFGCQLDDPLHLPRRGEITQSYQEGRTTFDLSSAGRGLRQTLLLLAYVHANPGAVPLLDEPDAQLGALRQRQLYDLLTRAVSDLGSQVIAATRSEVLLDEAAARDTVVAFGGAPREIGGPGGGVAKALNEIELADRLQAEQAGWVLYLRGAADPAILRALAWPFVKYVGDRPERARRHFRRVCEAVPSLRGLSLLGRSDSEPQRERGLLFQAWRRREVESYICTRATLDHYARASARSDAAGEEGAPGGAEEQRCSRVMKAAVSDVERALRTMRKCSPWSAEARARDEFLVPVFRR